MTDVEQKKQHANRRKEHKDGGEDKEPTAEEVYQEEQDELLKQSMKNEPSQTYQDVVTETRKHARRLIKSHKQKYAVLNTELASGRRQVRKEQKSIDEQCKEIQGKDSHEFSNYIVSRMDLQSKQKRK